MDVACRGGCLSEHFRVQLLNFIRGRSRGWQPCNLEFSVFEIDEDP